jgi:hypothetical protein
MDLFPSSGEEGETPTLLGPLERASLKHWTTPVRFTTDQANSEEDIRYAINITIEHAHAWN